MYGYHPQKYTMIFYLMPGPPTCATATAGNGEAAVSFKPPKSDGGSPIIRFEGRNGSFSGKNPISTCSLDA
jgi:hypothetical protein